MEYVVGPVIALMLGIKFTQIKISKQEEAIAELEERMELVQNAEEEMPKKVMATVMPIAKAVQKLNAEVGIQ